MDNVTAQACQNGRGKAEFARVLVEFDVKKGLKEEIDIQYKSRENVVKWTKKVDVDYQWKLDICPNCMVFGHNEKNCHKLETNNKGKDYNADNRKGSNGKKIVEEEFVEVRNRKVGNIRSNNNYVKNQQKWGVKHSENHGGNNTYRRKETEKKISRIDEILPAIKKSKSKYVVLKEEEYNEEKELRQLKDRMIVDQYLNKRMEPTSAEAQNWSKDMISYFKLEWYEVSLKDKEGLQENIKDAMEGGNMSAKMCSANEVSGMESVVLH
ncbi:RNA-directed DNA polymerase, eukaryota, reverse transcriptase zinc-binding domain protein [Tanacetum coccineum]